MAEFRAWIMFIGWTPEVGAADFGALF